MDVVTPHQLRLLAFVKACGDHDPTRGQVTTWLRSPTPNQGFLWVGGAELAERMSLFSAFASSAESDIDHLIRLGWLGADNDRVYLTDLGAALYASASRDDDQAAGPTTVLLGRADPLAYAGLIGVLAGAGAGLLVDPYLKLHDLALIIDHTTIRRVLLSTKQDVSIIAEIGVFLATQKLPRDVEVRASSDSKMHDRLIIGSRSEVLVMGASVNTVRAGTGTYIVELLETAAAPTRREAEEFWRSATPLPIPVASALPPPVASTVGRPAARRNPSTKRVQRPRSAGPRS